jgi:ferrous iron transport protein B
MKQDAHRTVVLAGLESVGKSALFRGLSGASVGDEANYRGSTVVCRVCRLQDCGCDLVDTPGIRVRSDASTTDRALAAMRHADVLLLVARGTHAVSEVQTLLQELDATGKRSVLAITFADKAPDQIEALVAHYESSLGIPVVLLNARELDAAGRRRVLAALDEARPLTQLPVTEPELPNVDPPATWYEHARLGPVLAVLSMVLMFALPLYAAYEFAAWLQPLADTALLTPLKAALSDLPALAQVFLTGSYGILTLGWYSFLWAFPVVALLAASVAIVEETGCKDRITAALDPALRHVGLSGRDLIPVLGGFGCKVVAVMQSRSCSRCTRGACVSMISFSSACSYQIGATLSVLAAAGHPWLFAPYIGLLFVVGALHTRVWHGPLARTAAAPMHQRSFIQRPSLRAMLWRVRGVVKQFLFQAMPIFLLICLVAAAIEHAQVLRWMDGLLAPLVCWCQLPEAVAPGILLSLLRKDGLLVLHSGEGALLAALSAGQVLVLVWLASTLAPCLVTAWTVRKELGSASALKLLGRQFATSLASTAVLVAAMTLLK